MKLELKHLAAYLPYNLNVFSGDSVEIYQLVGLHINWQENFNTYDRKIKLSNGEERKYSQNIKYCRPILRPISDIAKEIEIDGKKIIPIIELSKLVTGANDCKLISGTVSNFIYVECENDNYIDTLIFSLNLEFWYEHYFGNRNKHSRRNTFNHREFYEKLLEWHFDIFGLIENGLAIDVNKIA